MSKKILAFFGTKEAGKSSAAKFVERNRVELFGSTDWAPPSCQTDRRVRRYSFAGPIKDLCVKILGLEHRQVWGTEADKNSLTSYRWEDLPHYRELQIGWMREVARLKVPGEDCSAEYNRRARVGLMTAREVLQEVGTGIFRRMNPSIWADACLREILAEPFLDVATVEDGRFPQELVAVQKAGGKCILLTRRPHQDAHESENSLPSPEVFDAVIDNRDLTESQTHAELVRALAGWGWANRPEAVS